MKERTQSISILRLFSTLMVFVFHFLTAYTEFGKKYFPMYFVVQVFLFLSGYLYGGKKIKSVKKFYAKNFVKILLPAMVTLIIVGVAAIVIYLCGIRLTFSKTGLTGETYLSYGHYWFIGAILFCYLITPILWIIYEFRACNKGNSKKAQALEFFIVFLILADYFISLTGTQRLVTAYVCGFVFRKLKESRKITDIKLTLSLSSALIFVLTTVGCYFLSTHNKTLLTALMRETTCLLLGVSLSVFVLTVFGDVKSKKENRFLNITDKYSYTFFLAHHFFVVATFSELYKSVPSYLNFLISLSLTVFVAIIVDLICAPIIKKTVCAMEKNKKTIQDDLKQELPQDKAA